jgi:hypothetical protein
VVFATVEGTARGRRYNGPRLADQHAPLWWSCSVLL